MPKTFRATLERHPSRLNWVVVRVPLDIGKLWGIRGQVRVKGKINGFAFRTSLFPTGTGNHILLVNNRMQSGSRTRAGMVAEFRLERDTEKHVVRAPAELTRALAEDDKLVRWFQRLPESLRNEIAKWVSQVKSAEARMRRSAQITERLLATMEAEQELPPILKAEFARNPLARRGWERMSGSRRRRHLLGIFGYQSPESRARRTAKAMEEAVQVAQRAGQAHNVPAATR